LVQAAEQDEHHRCVEKNDFFKPIVASNRCVGLDLSILVRAVTLANPLLPRRASHGGDLDAVSAISQKRELKVARTSEL
jgi:hypothetical protein